LQIAERFRYLPDKTEPTRHLAYHALSKGDVNQALGYARQALTLREESGFRPYLPFDHLLLCDIYLRLKDVENAKTHAQKAFTLAEEMGYKSAIASSLLSLGDVISRANERLARIG